MPSLHKDPRGKSPYWFCAFTDQNGARHFKSTKAADKKQAWQICQSWQKAINFARTGKLNVDQARTVFAAGVADVLAAGGQSLPSATVRDWCKRWLDAKELENESSTNSRYELAIRPFLGSLGPLADRDLGQLSADNVLAYRDACTKSLSVASTNTNLKIVRACLNSAYRQGLVDRNVAVQVKTLKERGESKRRALTIQELRDVLKTCRDTAKAEKEAGRAVSYWEGLVLTGLYTGQRLADVARLTWQQVDLIGKSIHFETQKTGKRLSMHLAEPLHEYLSAMPSADKPEAFVFPRFGDMAEKNISSLSNAFALEVLIPAKLMVPRPENKKSTGKGRSGKRQVNPVTFHSLRHSFTTMLKAAGASNALAQLIVGHDSPAVSRRYTHLSAEDTVEPISKLPKVS